MLYNQIFFELFWLFELSSFYCNVNLLIMYLFFPARRLILTMNSVQLFKKVTHNNFELSSIFCKATHINYERNLHYCHATLIIFESSSLYCNEIFYKIELSVELYS